MNGERAPPDRQLLPSLAPHSRKIKNSMDNPETILRYGSGFAPPLIIEAAARNGVFDALESGPKSVAEVASVTGSSTRGLKSIMNALVGLELLTRDSAGKFGLTTGAMPSGEMASQASRLIPPWLNL